MKFFTHGLLPLLLLVGVIGGVSYFSQYARTPPPAAPATAAPTFSAATVLDVPARLAVWDENEPQYTAELLMGTPHHFDFWLTNPNDKPVTLELRRTSCTCASVSLGLLPPADLVRWQRDAATVAALPLPGEALTLAALAAAVPVGPKVAWTPLPEKGKPVPIPGRTDAGPSAAVVRMNWTVKTVGPQRVSANLSAVAPDGQPFEQSFEVPILGVGPVLVSNLSVQLGDIKAGDRKPITVYCWSPVLDAFPLTARDETPDPCVEVVAVERLTTEELRTTVPAQLRRDHPNYPLTRMKSGYRIKMIVHERRGNAQLDLGPFKRRIVMDIGKDSDAAVMLGGAVRGTLRVGGEDDKDQIQLGTFRSDRPHEKVVAVTSEQTDSTLKVVSVSVPGVVAELRDVPAIPGRKAWELRVEIPPGIVSGQLTLSDVVVLESTSSAGVRRMRVPLVGIGYRR